MATVHRIHPESVTRLNQEWNACLATKVTKLSVALDQYSNSQNLVVAVEFLPRTALSTKMFAMERLLGDVTSPALLERFHYVTGFIQTPSPSDIRIDPENLAEGLQRLQRRLTAMRHRKFRFQIEYWLSSYPGPSVVKVVDLDIKTGGEYHVDQTRPA